VIQGSYKGLSLPRPPSSDSNEDRELDFDGHRDFMDQDDPAGQFPTVDPGPIHQFLSGIPDWLNFNPEDLDRALASLPIPLEGPSPPFLICSVKQWHNIHIGHHKTIILQIYRYTISYIDIVQYIGSIIFDIVYNIGYDIVYDV
jgi:hypothetical protein